MIYVTKPFLPKLEEYTKYLEGIWERNWLTNNGPLVNELELVLKEYLKLDHLLYTSNGTIALQIAIKALNLKGEVITTPFSYVATTSTIVWEGCKPVFVDIDPNTLNIDPNKLESAITKETTAIIATHVFGNPCDIDSIQTIANKHNLKVIFDAAHCFGTKYKNKSVLEYGDISTTSFHSTKLFHTIEGGAVITKSPTLLKKMALMRNFGHSGYEDFDGVGINGKNSEFHAAMGLANIAHIESILNSRKEQSYLYNQKLSSLRIKKPTLCANSISNYSYYPIIFETENQLLNSIKELNNNHIFPRRYFYPSLSVLHYVDKYDVPIAESIAKRILCLPLYFNLKKEDIDFISRILLRIQNN